MVVRRRANTCYGKPFNASNTPGPIECQSFFAKVKSKKGKTSSITKCQERCQNNWEEGCVGFNFQDKNTICELFILVDRDNSNKCSGRPWFAALSDKDEKIIVP